MKLDSGEIVEFKINFYPVFDSCTVSVELASITSASSKKVSRAGEKYLVYVQQTQVEYLWP